jgi:hypothetical protein
MYGVKLAVPIQWPKKEVPIDPRILGMWLGDGGKNTAVFTNPDIELIDYFKKWTEEKGGKFHTQKDNLHHNISYCDFLGLLRENNFYDNKHIPEDYIVNDVETRLKLLAGIIDTDGSVEQDGTIIRIDQCFEHKPIIDGIERIAKSLGFKTSVHTRKTKWKHNCETKKGEALELTISGYGVDKIPTLIQRKKCKNPLVKYVNCTKIEIVENGIGKFCGFEVDQNNRFLLGDLTITHNCNQTGRTVIGPDPTLRLGELAVPIDMAEVLTVPVRATSFNIKMLQKMIDDGKVDSLLKPDGKTRINLKRFRKGTRLLAGDIIIKDTERVEVVTGRELVYEGDKVERNGEILDKILPCNRTYAIQEGWIVERKLQNGDYVLLNRQPTEPVC